MFKQKLSSKETAFTLLELIIVVVVLAIISAYVFTRRDSSSDYEQDTVIEQIISAARLAQQLSMNDNQRAFSLVISTNQVNLLDGGASFSSGAITFPLVFGSKVSLSPSTSIVFDSLGRTTSTTLTVSVNGISRNMCFQASGYIHRC